MTRSTDGFFSADIPEHHTEVALSGSPFSGFSCDDN